MFLTFPILALFHFLQILSPRYDFLFTCKGQIFRSIRSFYLLCILFMSVKKIFVLLANINEGFILIFSPDYIRNDTNVFINLVHILFCHRV